MHDALTAQVTELLNKAAAAHHVYETDELKGVRDEQWPAWYADFLITNGLADLLGTHINLDDLSTFLEKCNEQQKSEGSKESWYVYTAPRILERFI